MYKSKSFPTTRRGRDEFLAKNRQEKATREAEINRLLKAGHSNAEIASAVSVSIRTIYRRRKALQAND